MPESPAVASGLRVQDAIIAIDGKAVRFASPAAALDYFAAIRPGTVLRLTVLRDEKQRIVTLRATEIPEQYVRDWKMNDSLAKQADGKKRAPVRP